MTMKIQRRILLQTATAAAGLAAFSRVAAALDYPTRPVRVIVGFPPGGAADIFARLITPHLTTSLGQTFLIDNRPGAGGDIAATALVQAAPDGYTLLIASVANSINATLHPNPKFHFPADMTPVSGISLVPLVMVVNPSVPAKTVPEFIAYTKSNPGKLSMASPGIGTAGHVAGELFKMTTGLDMVHVPYHGGAPALIDLLGGRVQVEFSPLPDAIGYIRAGKLRALAVTTAARAAALPKVPTVNEFVPGYEASAWWGMCAPKNTPASIAETLNKKINAALADETIKDQFAKLGGSPMLGSVADFGKFIAADTAKWAKVVKFASIKAE
jgi:tripartite-type tricarboxylate transporter receptor subunit TctC